MIKDNPDIAMSRRAVVAGVVASCAAVGVLAAQRMAVTVQSRLSSAIGKGPPLAVSTASAEMVGWSNVIGSTFQLTGASGTVTARLTKVEALNSGGARPAAVSRAKAFGLRFDVIGPALQQGDGLYSLSGPGTAGSELFFTRAPMQLFAIFN